MKVATKEKSLQVLEKELDDVFSDFIRLRDSHSGRVSCFICGVQIPWRSSQCAHFKGRTHMPTRYHEENCHAACENCNCFDDDHLERYELKMIEKYGEGHLEYLDVLAHSLQKFMRSDLHEMLGKYKEKVKELKRTKVQ